MRVTFCISSLACGGAEKSLITLCQHLTELHRIQCTIVTSLGQPFFDVPSTIQIVQGDFAPNENENILNILDALRDFEKL
jgi:hypothetical protein